MRQWGRAVLDLLMPPQCLGCGGLIERDGALCVDCWRQVTFIGHPHCAACGLPFELAPEGGMETADGALCAACIARPTVFERARAVVTYDDASRPFILSFKYADRVEAAATFAGWMARAGAELLTDADLIAPIPLHRTRLFRRRYNQAALLGQHLGRLSGRPFIADLLIRSRPTPSQGRLSPSARRRNVGGAFRLRATHAEAIRNKRVLLVDDVLTTGATAGAATRALLKGGAGAVDILTLGRVAKPFPL